MKRKLLVMVSLWAVLPLSAQRFMRTDDFTLLDEGICSVSYEVSYVLDSTKPAEKEKDVVYFNFEYRNGNSGEILPPLHFSIEMADYDGSKKRAEAVRYHHNVPWTKMVKRELLDIHHIRFEEVPNGNDIFFSLMVGYFCYDSIEVIKKPLYVYLRNDNSITSKKATAYSSFCVIRHSIQLNRFYHFIGHNEWRWPTLKLILYHIKLCGIPFLYLLLRKTCYLINHREDWISILKKNG